jgi:hypothetical protein
VKGEFLAKLRFLFGRVLVQFLATLKLLAREEMDLPLLRSRFLPGESSSLVKLVSLSEQGVIESLMRMKSLFGQVAQPLLDLHVERQGHPQVDPPLFLLQVPD